MTTTSLTADGSKTYSWNARNGLTGISGGVSASFAYDAVGRGRSRTVASTTTEFLYDGLNPVQELASGTPTANLLTGLGIDEYFTRTDGAGARHLVSDALGSTIALPDGSGSVQTDYTYEPFGSVTTSGSASANTFGFTATEKDGTGLNYYRARCYDPRLQRFTGDDPIGTNGGINTHAYANNQPTMVSIRWVSNRHLDSADRHRADPLGAARVAPENLPPTFHKSCVPLCRTGALQDSAAA
jgi:RHS repeat-associated protein